MKTIRFTERRTVDYMDGEGVQVYEDGSTHTLRDDKAQRWVTRNAAEFVDAPEVAEKPAETPAAKPADAKAKKDGK